MPCERPTTDALPLTDVYETAPVYAEAVRATFCDRCRGVHPVRRNKTQVRCDRCGRFLGHREPRVQRLGKVGPASREG